MATLRVQAVTRLLVLVVARLAVLSLLRTPLHQGSIAALSFLLEVERFLVKLALEMLGIAGFAAVLLHYMATVVQSARLVVQTTHA